MRRCHKRPANTRDVDYLHVDGLGSVRQITDAAGSVVGEMRYSPFGEIEAMSGLPAMFGYTSEQHCGSNNLVYLRARYYNPALGRFLTQDSVIPDVTNGQALNAYAYVYNDPINLTDPSGNVPSLPVQGLNMPDRDDMRDSTRRIFERGLDFIDNWYSQPEDCDCGHGLPKAALNYTENLNTIMGNPAAQLAFGLWTTPAQRIASRVDVYGRWPASTSFGKVGVDRYSTTYHDVDITNLKMTDIAEITQASSRSPKIIRMGDGRKVIIHNSTTRTTVGPRGLISSIIGAGLIDAAFQLYNDWAQGLCLSPNQFFWRAYVALLFGLGVGAVGAAAVFLLVAAGAPGIVAGLGGFAVSTGLGLYFER